MRFFAYILFSCMLFSSCTLGYPSNVTPIMPGDHISSWESILGEQDTKNIFSQSGITLYPLIILTGSTQKISMINLMFEVRLGQGNTSSSFQCDAMYPYQPKLCTTYTDLLDTSVKSLMSILPHNTENTESGEYIQLISDIQLNTSKSIAIGVGTAVDSTYTGSIYQYPLLSFWNTKNLQFKNEEYANMGSGVIDFDGRDTDVVLNNTLIQEGKDSLLAGIGESSVQSGMLIAQVQTYDYRVKQAAHDPIFLSFYPIQSYKDSISSPVLITLELGKSTAKYPIFSIKNIGGETHIFQPIEGMNSENIKNTWHCQGSTCRIVFDPQTFHDAVGGAFVFR